jgi:hypothetical protein
VKKLPAYIRLGSTDYLITFFSDELEEHYYGRINYTKGTVQLNKNRLENQGGADTVLHEVLHGLITEYGIENYMAGDDANDRHQSEEQVVRLLSHGLVTFMRDNPDLVRWITARVNRPIAGDR